MKKPISLREVVETFLRTKVGDCFCNACIARELGQDDVQGVSRVTGLIGSGHRIEFSRYTARCVSCGNQGAIVRAKPNFGLR